MTSRIAVWSLLLALLLWGGVRVTAIDPDAPKPPVLSDVDKRDLLLAFKDLEIAQLKLQALVTKLTPPGFTINERLELVPLPKPETKPKATP
jgi:hypothetical protein